ncbi:MAG: flagellar type III secretion system protein FlhB [Pseudomonadota bacterium]
MAEENASGGGEKTEAPTPRKLEEARRKGDVVKSADIAAAAVYGAVLIAVLAMGPAAVQASGAALAGLIGHADALQGRMVGAGGQALYGALALEVAGPLAPLLLAPLAAAVLAYAAQRAVVPSADKIKPKLSRISPLANAKQKYGAAGMVEFLKAAVKLTAVSAVLALVLAAETDRLLALVRLDARALGEELSRLGVALLSAVTAVAAAVAAGDYLWQRFHHARKLRMSMQEIRDELKNSEGDPHLKAERRRRGQKIAANRMLLEVPKADVVIVNPTHYAVALKWSRKPGAAPVCVAKGVDEIALAIRARAAEAQVPVRDDPPAARTLYATVELGDEIRPEHYRAVAAAIRWAESVRRAARDRGARR